MATSHIQSAPTARDQWVADKLNGMIMCCEANDEAGWNRHFEDLLATPADLEYPSYHVLMFSTAKPIVKDAELAEDIVQTATIKVWQSAVRRGGGFDPSRPLASARPAASVGKFLKTAVRNLAIDALNRQREELGLEGLPGISDAPDDEVIDLRNAVGTLPAHLEEVVRLYSEGYAFHEIGKLLGVSKTTASNRWQQAVIALRGRLMVVDATEPELVLA
jgi:RNA polymerase sigma factor (sigma-70 family)